MNLAGHRVWRPSRNYFEPCLKSLHYKGTGHTKRSEEQVAGTCPKNSNWFEFVGLDAGTKQFLEGTLQVAG